MSACEGCSDSHCGDCANREAMKHPPYVSEEASPAVQTQSSGEVLYMDTDMVSAYPDATKEGFKEAQEAMNALFRKGFTVPMRFRMNSVYGKMGVQSEADRERKKSVWAIAHGYFLAKRIRNLLRVI